MSHGLMHRLVVAAGANVFGQFANAIMQVVSLPLLLHFWGTEVYGEWIVVSTLPHFLAMSQTGFVTVAGSSMIIAMNRNSPDDVLEVYQTTVLLVLALTVVLCGAAGIGACFIQPKWLSSSVIGGQSLLFMAPLFIGQFIVLQLIALHAAGFRTIGLVARGTMWSNVARLVGWGGICVTAALGYSPVFALAASVAMIVLSATLIHRDLAKRASWLKMGWRRSSKRRFKEMVRPSVAFMAFPLGHGLRNQGTVLIVAQSCGPSVVVAFSAIRTLTNLASQVVGLVHRTLQPELSAAYGAGELALMRRLHRRGFQLALFLSLSSAAALATCGPLIFHVWTSGKLQLDPTLFRMFLAIVVLNNCWLLSLVVTISVNAHYVAALVYLAATAMSIVAASWLAPVWGATGVVVSLLAVDSLMILAVVPAAIGITRDHLLGFVASQFGVPDIRKHVAALWIPAPTPPTKNA